jgi:hypothetical protein
MELGGIEKRPHLHFAVGLKNKLGKEELLSQVNSTTKCNFDKCLVAKDVLVSKASRPASQSRHDLSTP